MSIISCIFLLIPGMQTSLHLFFFFFFNILFFLCQTKQTIFFVVVCSPVTPFSTCTGAKLIMVVLFDSLTVNLQLSLIIL